MKKSWIILSLLALLASCETREDVVVKYLISNNETGFQVNYLDEKGALKTEVVELNSAEDQWSYTFTTEQGEIVFVSARYKNINDGIKVSLLLDGKTFKQGASNGDTLGFVTVSGTIPYN